MQRIGREEYELGKNEEVVEGKRRREDRRSWREEKKRGDDEGRASGWTGDRRTRRWLAKMA